MSPLPLRLLVCVRRMDAGGAEMLEARLAANLARLGHEVHLAGQYGGMRFDTPEAVAGWIKLGVHRVHWLGGGGGVGVVRAALSLRRLAREFHFDAVITYNIGLDTSAWLSRCLGASFSHVVAHHEYYSPGDLSPLRFHLWRHAVRQADQSYAISDYVRASVVRVCGLAPATCTTVINSIGPITVGTLPNREHLRQEFGIGAGEKIIVFVGRLVANKGCDLLIERLGPHLEKWNARLLLVGWHFTDPENLAYYQRLRHLAANQPSPTRILFTGHRSDVTQIIATADVLAHSAVHEGFGLVIAEALVLGTPVVATEVGGIPEILAGSPCRPLPIGDAAGFVREVERWLEPEPQSASALAAASRAAADRFTDARRAAEIEAILRKTVMRRIGQTEVGS